jgi:hypothetical protein
MTEGCGGWWLIKINYIFYSAAATKTHGGRKTP